MNFTPDSSRAHDEVRQKQGVSRPIGDQDQLNDGYENIWGHSPDGFGQGSLAYAGYNIVVIFQFGK
jgi:hypothetical protein